MRCAEFFVERDSAAFRALVAKVMNLGALEIEDGWVEDGDVQVFKFVTKPVRTPHRCVMRCAAARAPSPLGLLQRQVVLHPGSGPRPRSRATPLLVTHFRLQTTCCQCLSDPVSVP